MHDVGGWMAFVLGAIVGAVIGGPAGAAFIMVRARYRLLRTATINARAHVGGIARALGVVALVTGGAVLVVIGLARGWWSS